MLATSLCASVTSAATSCSSSSSSTTVDTAIDSSVIVRMMRRPVRDFSLYSINRHNFGLGLHGHGNGGDDVGNLAVVQGRSRSPRPRAWVVSRVCRSRHSTAVRPDCTTTPFPIVKIGSFENGGHVDVESSHDLTDRVRRRRRWSKDFQQPLNWMASLRACSMSARTAKEQQPTHQRS